MFSSHQEAKDAGWFSRRHQDDGPNREERTARRNKAIRKRAEAAERQAARDARTPQEQLDLIVARCGPDAAGKEVTRLKAQIEREK